MKQSKSNRYENINEEIEKISLHRFKPFISHYNIAPFFILYIVWFVLWSHYFGFDAYPELGFIMMAVIATFQVLTCLFCYWFVPFRVFMQCVKVRLLLIRGAVCVL
jgi:hypothetical protein